MNAITIYLVQDLFRFITITDTLVHGFIQYMGDWRTAFYIACTIAIKWLFLYFLYESWCVPLGLDTIGGPFRHTGYQSCRAVNRFVHLTDLIPERFDRDLV